MRLLLAALVAGFWLTVGSSGHAATEPRIALVIGNSDYVNSAPLPNPARDAKLMAGSLAAAGFEVLEFSNLDQRAMKRAVRDFADKVGAAGGGTVALFYYAGHGLQVEGVNYLVPVDASIENESDVAIEAIGLPDVLSAIEFARAQLNIVILDACRDNPLKRSFRSASRGLARVDAPTGSLVAYATAPGDVAADGEGANSPYSAALAQALLAPGIPIEQVFKQVRIEVRDATGGKQVPWESSSLTSDFYFIPGDSTAPGVVVAPQPVNPSAGNAELAEDEYLAAVSANTVEAYRSFLSKHPNSPRAGQVRDVLSVKVEDDAWRRADDTGTAAAYRQYLAAFPDGTHAATAGQQIAALESGEAATDSGGSCGPHGNYHIIEIPQNDILSVRTSPDRNAEEIGTIPPDGSGIGIGRCVSVQGYRYPWCEVRYACISGWAYARYLADDGGSRPGGSQASTTPSTGGSETYRVTDVESWDFLNLRSGPGTNFSIVVPIPPDATGVAIGQCRTVQGYRTKWCEAEWQGHSGWASSCCLVGEQTGRRAD